MEFLSEVMDEKIYSGKTKNGLKYYIIPKKDFNFKTAAIVVNYGSKDIYEGSPDGTAHFIEHKLFENEDGNAFDNFVKNNAEANAFTDFNKTVYYFSTAGDFYKSLEVLMGFVSRPYFERESVEREKDIIKQEIAMYGDDPYWKTYFDCLENLYPKSSLREIAGTAESVEKIDAETLYKCYDAFYRTENITLICCGDVDREVILDIAEKTDFKTGCADKEGTVFNKEGGTETLRDMGLSVPVFTLGIPLIYNERCNTLWAKYRIKVLMDIIAGNASRVYNNLYNSGVLNEPLGSSYVCGEGYAAMVFTGQAKEYEKAASVIKEFMLDLKQNGVSEKDFGNCHQKACGRFVRGFNSVDAVVMAQADISDKGDIITAYDEVSKMTRFELDMIMREYVDLEAAVLSGAI
ncbi:MAG: insulinase family protein [Lachnospiraceae bacterium]|nr:insulinase family protein [Lachnospiraceae bacterium]